MVEESATEWFGSEPSPMRTWFVQAVKDPKQHRDIGKLLAPGAEMYVNTWLEHRTGRPIRHVVGASYDGITDDVPYVRHQTKFRMGEWHLETTRRHSKKNKESVETGHVKYKKDEFDILVIFIPGPFFSLSQAHIRCIPVDALIDPKKPSHLIAYVPKSVRRLYDTDESTDAVIQLMYQTLPSIEDEYQITCMIDQVIDMLVQEFLNPQTDQDMYPPLEYTDEESVEEV